MKKRYGVYIKKLTLWLSDREGRIFACDTLAEAAAQRHNMPPFQLENEPVACEIGPDGAPIFEESVPHQHQWKVKSDSVDMVDFFSKFMCDCGASIDFDDAAKLLNESEVSERLILRTSAQ